MGTPGTKSARLEARSRCVVTTTADLASFAVGATSEHTSPERAYCATVPIEHRKHFGQFFTPVGIADLMVDWVALVHPKTLLDPAVGPGIFVRTLLTRAPQCEVTALDTDPVALEAARRAIPTSVLLQHADFLTWGSDALYDAILLNPPYIRHHDMSYDGDIFATVGRRNRIILSRLTNAYGLFILEACRRLRPGGRAAIIVPAEWTNANFGAPIKEFLLSRGFLRQLVYFSHAHLLFEDALTTACVLLIEKANALTHIRTIYVDGEIDIASLRAAVAKDEAPNEPGIRVRSLPSAVLQQEPKWDSLLKDGLPIALPGFVSLSTLATTRRGIATGANDFFHVTARVVRDHDIDAAHAIPCIGRANEVRGFVFDQDDYESLVKSGRRAFLLTLNHTLSETERRYLALGEASGLPNRYLLACRDPWYAMEKRDPAPIWAAVFGRLGLRFVWNRAKVSNLTTFHCIYPCTDEPAFAGALVACLNSPSVQAMSRYQSRVYGDGLRKFEPRDLLDIKVPNLGVVRRNTVVALCDRLQELDAECRSKAATSALAVELDRQVALAAREAAKATTSAGPAGTPRRLEPAPLLWD